MTPAQANRAVDLFTAGVVVSVAVALAGLSWRLAGAPADRLGSTATATAAIPPIDLGPLFALAPFGSAAPVATAATASDLQLRGTMIAVPASASVALIAAAGAPAKSFAIGDAVGGATVTTIAFDHVELRGPNGTQTLAFHQATSGAGGAAPPTTGDVAAMRALIPESARGAPAAPPANLAAIAPPPARNFLDGMGATPTSSGYRIGATLSPAMEAAGLQPGDLVERVNGAAVGDPQRDSQLWASAMAAGSARVDVVRNGQRITLSFPLR